VREAEPGAAPDSAMTVLVAVDTTPDAPIAVAVAQAIARQLGARLEGLHVSSAPVSEGDVRPLLGLSGEEGESIHLRLDVGNPAHEIVAASSDGTVVLVVIAAGMPTDESPVGPVALEVVRHTHRPLVVVYPAKLAGEGRSPGPVRRLLVPVDGTPSTGRALRPVMALAHELGASVDLLYVAGFQRSSSEPGTLSAPRYVDQPQHEWPSWSGEVVDRLLRCLARCPEDVPAEIHLATGDVAEEIARFALEHREDAIVLARRSQLEPGNGKVVWDVFQNNPLPLVFITAQFRHAGSNATAPYRGPSGGARVA